MQFRRTHKKYPLKDPFPVKKLITLDFGDVDGFRDKIIEKTFIETTSIKLLKQGRHSIISGPIGSGKSAIFKLLNSKSKWFEAYINNRIIVSIDEYISFQMLRDMSKDLFPKYDSKLIYQIIWFFHIVTRISESISALNNFPLDDNEKEINKFLKDINYNTKNLGILDKIKYFFQEFSAKIEAKISNTPLSLQTTVETKNKQNSKKINLNKLLNHCNSSIENRKLSGILIIIDKIDKFVAGEDYETQRKYIKSLLDVEDDLSCINNLDLNIFIRNDLFSRLDYSSLGYDKISDRTLKLEWTDDEILKFVSTRILNALETADVASLSDILKSTDLSQYSDINRFNSPIYQFFPTFFKRIIIERIEKNNSKRTHLITALSKSIITKVFPRKISHCNNNGESEEVFTCNFIKSHFRDGRGVTTPRYLLIFLKNVQKEVASYYDDNPHLTASVVQFGSDFEWKLFERKSVYKAYIESKMLYIKNLCNIDPKWTKWIVQFIANKHDKKDFNFKWIKTNIITSANDEDITAFMAFLQSVGYFRIKKHDPDFKKRVFELPIIYSSTPIPNPVLN